MLPEVAPWVFSLETMFNGQEIEGGGFEFLVHFFPVKGRGNRSFGQPPYGVGRS